MSEKETSKMIMDETVESNVKDGDIERLNPCERKRWVDDEHGKKLYISDTKNNQDIIVSVSKFVAEYRLDSVQIFPYGACKIRIWQNFGGDRYWADSNIGIIDRTNGGYTEDGIVVHGKSAEEALEKMIDGLIDLICHYEKKFGTSRFRSCKISW